jgi:prepilin-type N-terminal cleavage/methylation domain-containing protein
MTTKNYYGKRGRGIPMPSHRSGNTGFTLIELLISTLILASIILLAILSYSSFLNAWESKRLTDSDALAEYRSHLLLRYAVESAYDYFVTDPANERLGIYYPYFKGYPDRLEFVTLSSVFCKGSPAAARMRVLRDENEEVQRLVYEEAPLDGIYIRYNDTDPDYKEQMVSYKDLKNVRFRYYGVEEIRWNHRLDNLEEIYGWQETYQGKEKKGLPEMIELLLTTEQGDTRLAFSVKGGNIYKDYFRLSE